MFEEIVNSIEKLSLVELAELKSELEKRFGVMATQVYPTMISPAEVVPEVQTEFTVTLVSAGEMKINVIKLVREITGLDLVSSKAFVDSLPKVVKEGLSEDDSKILMDKFVAVGATAVIQ